MPSSRDENSPPAEDDNDKTDNDVNVKLSDEEHVEFKWHLVTLPKKMREELLAQLRFQHEMKDDSSNSQVKRNLMKDYEDEDKDDDADRKNEEDREIKKSLMNKYARAGCNAKSNNFMMTTRKQLCDAS